MNKNFDLTLLSEGQIWGAGKEEQLYVMKKYGVKAAVTDLCILTGCYITNKNHINEDNSLSGRTGRFWTRSKWDRSRTCELYNPYDVCVVDKNGEWDDRLRFDRLCSVRPVLHSSLIYSQIFSNRVIGYNGTLEVEYGEYPQWAAESKMQQILELEYSKGLNKTGESYTFDSSDLNDYNAEFIPVIYDVYEYQGRKYIRARVNYHFEHYDTREITLSNNKEYKNGQYVWIEVSPVKWLIDEKTHTLISKYGLVSGLAFQFRWKRMKNSCVRCDSPYNGDFKKTDMYEYLNTYMSRDLFQSLPFVYDQDLNSKEKGKIKKLLFFRF